MDSTQIEATEARRYAAYEAWFRQADQAIQDKFGVSADDLPDQCWSDWFDDGVSPEQAAELVSEEIDLD
jgi:hypothetical protein